MVARRLLEQSWTRLRTKFNIHELFSIARLEIALRWWCWMGLSAEMDSCNEQKLRTSHPVRAREKRETLWLKSSDDRLAIVGNLSMVKYCFWELMSYVCVDACARATINGRAWTSSKRLREELARFANLSRSSRLQPPRLLKLRTSKLMPIPMNYKKYPRFVASRGWFVRNSQSRKCNRCVSSQLLINIDRQKYETSPS